MSVVDALSLPTVGQQGIAGRIAVWQGDITKLKADMIVNAANKTLLGGGGVDGAIHAAAGPELLEEAKILGGAETGQTKVTKGYNLPATWIAHTVGPIYNPNQKHESAQQLASCYRTSLEALLEKGGKTIGFPAVSTGAYGFPVDGATDVALSEVAKFLYKDKEIERVVFVVHSKEDEVVYHDQVEGHLIEG